MTRKRRPLSIEVFKFKDGQEDDEDSPPLRSESLLFPTIATTSHPTSQAPKISFIRSVATQEPTHHSRTIHTSATIASQKKSPTRTTFITITQSIRSPRGKEGDSPEPTQTVFFAAPTQIVTITASANVAVPTVEILPPSVPQTKGGVVSSPWASRPVVAMSVVGE
jgi:hypothetical protein